MAVRATEPAWLQRNTQCIFYYTYSYSFEEYASFSFLMKTLQEIKKNKRKFSHYICMHAHTYSKVVCQSIVVCCWFFGLAFFFFPDHRRQISKEGWHKVNAFAWSHRWNKQCNCSSTFECTHLNMYSWKHWYIWQS